MSLPSPLSVGDALLLATLAYDIAKAFKSAPTEFCEIQSLLFSVSDTLKLLGRTLPTPGNQGHNHWRDDEAYISIANNVANCRSVLAFLDVFVKKYSVLAAGTSNRKWSEEVKRNWKRLVWTKEGGDISKLKQSLNTHINALNLAITIVNG